MPFEEAVASVEELTGMRVSNHFAHDTLTAVGETATLELVISDADEVARRIPQDRMRICLLGDGADWVWSAMVEWFATGRQILDFNDAMEYLHATSRALHGEGSLEGRQWAESTMVRLAEGPAGTVLEQLRRLRPREGEQAAEEVRKLIGYLEGQRRRLSYLDAIKGGYPI